MVTTVNTFAEFLRWCREYRDAHGENARERLRWLYSDHRCSDSRERYLNFKLSFCESCDHAMVLPSERRDRQRLRRFWDHAHSLYRFPCDTDFIGCEECGSCSSCCECSTCAGCDRRCDRENNYTCAHCDRCEDNCCECRFCERCGEECSDSRCSHCERCGSCCTGCRTCDDCGRECSDDYCGNCETCTGCCGCDEERANVRFFKHSLRFHTAKLNERKLNPSARYVSVEIEVASVGSGNRVSDVVGKWRGSIVEDGSLPNSGFEINTAPASGDKFVRQIEEICAALAEKQAKVTTACGLHVHVDARDFDYLAIRRLVKVYAKIESALFEMVSPSRRGSRFCDECGPRYTAAMSYSGAMFDGANYRTVKHGVIKSVYSEFTPRHHGRLLESWKANKYNTARYAALNLHSWFHRKTVECRMFNGTTSAEKIVTWGMLWARILDYVASHTDSEVEPDLHGTPLQVLERIAASPRLVNFIRDRRAKFAR